MKLISCYIAGFGKWKNATFDFKKDIVEFKQDNGWGKTTLLYFLESMLFGLDKSGNKKNLLIDLRKKYEPFDGGAYGGSLTFSHGGETYRIERTFGRSPAMDTVKLYDKNNMLCYTFGENVERLGELMLGVNRDTYHASAYLPQGETFDGEIPQDTKARLVQLLSSDRGAGGVVAAMERLKNAEKTIRPQRNTGRGKLDEIESRLLAIATEKTECERTLQGSSELANQLSDGAYRLEYLDGEIARLQTVYDEGMRANAAAAVWQTRTEIETQRTLAQGEVNKLQAVFGEQNPQDLNMAGLKDAVEEYYQTQAWLDENEERLRELQEQKTEKNAVHEKIKTCRESLENFEQMLRAQAETTGAGTRSKKKDKKKDKRKIGTTAGLTVSVAIALFGAALLETMPYLAIPLIAVGGVALLIEGLAIVLAPSDEKKKKIPTAFEDAETNARYVATQKEWEELQFSLVNYPQDVENKVRELETETQTKQERANALREGIERFLGNFHLPTAYDYRATLDLLSEKAERYAEWWQRLQDADEKLAGLPQNTGGQRMREEDLQDLQSRMLAYTAERNDLLVSQTTNRLSKNDLERVEERYANLLGEEKELRLEQERLEQRLTAIRTARDCLTRASENMATRYLEPVEQHTAELLKSLQYVGVLHFNAEGKPLVEEQGISKSVAHYSEGTRDLIGFCTRIALVKALYPTSRPVLIFDDPFTNFDDKTTEACKKLIKTLSKNYQIIYCTCKEERRL